MAASSYWPLWQLTISRMRVFYREPAAVFWVYGFPLVMALSLGTAFRENPKEQITLPEEFKQYAALFSNEEAKAFPPVQPWDHKIKLTKDAPTSFNQKIYPISRKEQEEENKFLDKNLTKGYIEPSDSPYGFSTFMVPKKDSDELCYIIDY